MVQLSKDAGWSVFAPIAFVAVIVILSMRYGMAAGVGGGLIAAAIFAYALFPPLGSLRVSDVNARANLGWMLLGGIALSFLLWRPPHGDDNTKRK